MNANRLWWVGLALVLGCSRAQEGSGPALSAAPSAAAAPGVPELVSGAGIGPVRIGMTRAELDALGLPVKPGPLRTEVLVGPYIASFEGERVRAVHVELRALPSGVRVGGTVFVAEGATMAAIAAKLPACGPVRHNTGASVIDCDGGRASVIAGGESGDLALAVGSPAPAGAPALPAAPPCGPDAYRHEGPDFCVELPASARGKAPTTIENGIAFPGILFNWTPRSNTAVIAEWKAPRRPAQHHGPFEIWTTEPMPRGTYSLIFDATQHDTQDIDKVPSVRGVAVVEGETTAVRCTVTISLEHGGDARAAAEAHAAELAACKSLRLFGRS